MKIGIGNDHHGVELKNRIISYLNSKGYETINYGCDFKDNTDYIDYAIKVCNAVNNKEVDFGILICGTGIGMSIVANKIKGIMCAKVSNPKEALLAKEHNMANVIALSESTENVGEILDSFINTTHSEQERHIRRIDRIKELENK